MENIQAQNLSDAVLLSELSNRIEKYKAAVEELNTLNKQLLELNQKLTESEAMKSHFISNITNEIINPFASILGLSKSIVECPETDVARMKKMATMIHGEAFNLDFQFKNIFAAAEIEAGEIQPNISVVNVDELLSSLFGQYAREMERKSLTKVLTNLEASGQPILFRTDSDKLMLIVSNLLCNAINFNRKGKKVEITFCRNENGELVINVTDEGIGISETNLNIIYDRFKRLDNGINSVNRGHGLGLSINKAYIDLLEGRLEVKSKENEGSTFSVIIPESPQQNNDYSEEGNEVFFGEEEIF
jgi:signal transduction histidine kinase